MAGVHAGGPLGWSGLYRFLSGREVGGERVQGQAREGLGLRDWSRGEPLQRAGKKSRESPRRCWGFQLMVMTGLTIKISMCCGWCGDRSPKHTSNYVPFFLESCLRRGGQFEWGDSGGEREIQGYLAHKKPPTPLGPPKDPRHRPTVGS